MDVPSQFGVNDSHVILNVLEKHLGIVTMARHIARDSIKAGRLVEILTDFLVPDLWVRALIPESRRHNPAVEALVQWPKDQSQPVSPWGWEGE